MDDLFDYCAPNGRLQMDFPLDTLRGNGARGSRSARQVLPVELDSAGSVWIVNGGVSSPKTAPKVYHSAIDTSTRF